MAEFSKKSSAMLATCHPDLQRLFSNVIQIADCAIICGFRNEAAQNAAVAAGKSRLHWPNSKHNTTPSLAVDVAPYPIKWDDVAGFTAFADLVKMTAKQLGIDVAWGGDWIMRDYPHWQLKSEN